jgi:hypothetical protein
VNGVGIALYPVVRREYTSHCVINQGTGPEALLIDRRQMNPQTNILSCSIVLSTIYDQPHQQRTRMKSWPGFAQTATVVLCLRGRLR